MGRLNSDTLSSDNMAKGDPDAREGTFEDKNMQSDKQDIRDLELE